MTDEKLSECSAESTGVYIDVHHARRRWKFCSSKRTSKTQARLKICCKHRLMPYSVDVIERSLTELVDEEVLTIEGDVLMQRRMVKDGNLSLIRANAGSKGGKTTQGKSVAGSFAKAKEQAKEQANTEYEYEDEIEDEDVSVNSKTKKDIYPILFDAFWQAYPKKVGKADALKAFKTKAG